jgi:hypothetical protein
MVTWEFGDAEGHKKARRAYASGLSGLHRMTLVITDGEFWWSWGELNPRPHLIQLVEL